jgi:fatty-acyl-CoA synthase
VGLFLRVRNGEWMTGERPKAFVVPRAGAVPTGRADHRARPNADRPPQGPNQVELVESLPKTSAGNIRKVELREAEWAGHRNRVQG